MKRILIVAIVVLSIAIALPYFLIPNHIAINKSMVFEANKEALYRNIGVTNTWEEWWPGSTNVNKEGRTYTSNSITFKPGPLQYTSVPLSIDLGDINVKTDLTLIAVRLDSTNIRLGAVVPTSNNPITRITRYSKAKKLARSFDEILHAIAKQYSTIQNLYGYDIQKKSVLDSTLMFISEELKGPPQIEKIYSLVDQLRNYIRNHDAKETNHPMLNIFTNDSINYLLKVAIPVDKKLPDSGNIHYRWMLGGGNILVTEVKGGHHEIKKAFSQIRHYVDDFDRIAPAIPFESLVTDRRSEPDTNKWITRIYFPVM